VSSINHQSLAFRALFIWCFFSLLGANHDNPGHSRA
jgi:hypothetical protein